MRHRLPVAFASMTLLSLAGYMGCTGDNSANPPLSSGGGDSGGNNSNGGNNSGGSLFSGGNSGTGGDMPCAQTEATATFVNRPIDIIVAIDNSGSMGGEIAQVEEQMTLNFGPILDAANPPIDYRVILVARHGDFNGPESICISQPLSNVPDVNPMDGHCDTVPAEPTDTAKFFHHSVEISSHNALCRFREQFDVADEFGHHPNGYKELLRDESFKFFLVITDDDVDSDGSCPFTYDDSNTVAGGDAVATQWDADMLALSPTHFGNANERNYTFWSIVALEPYNVTAQKPFGDPHPPDATLAPITTGQCSGGAVSAGTGYQSLSMLTGGYRYPTCPLEYSEIFTLMAQGVIAGSQVPCEFEIPDPGMGQVIDLETVEVAYESDGNFVETFNQVTDPADCDDHSFYIQDGNIVLCPEACAVVQADENAEMSIKFGCELNPT